jgi:nucleotidyltransferase substrate binding protein (TIGR01987 family)
MDLRLQSFSETLESFAYLTNVDIAALSSTLDPRLIDGLQNGKAQKFEYTLELGWKAIKAFVNQREGIDESSPKKVIKAFYLAGYIGENDYLALIEAIDDRNKLSHIYEMREFDLIVTRLPQYAELLQRVLEAIRHAADAL